MNYNIKGETMNLNLPETDTTAEITFNNRDEANLFAKMYTRHTLTGHGITGSTVKVWNVTDDTKQFIDDYISNLNKVKQ